MTTIQGPKGRPAVRPAAGGECRCQECATVARQAIQDGGSHAQWGPINDAVHGTESQPSAVHGAKHSMECQACQREAQRLRETGVRWVSWSAVRGAVHNGVEYAPQPDVQKATPSAAKSPKRRYRHFHDLELPFSFTMEQGVGAVAGLALSAPMIVAFGMPPEIATWTIGGLTALGALGPWIISKAGDTEKRRAVKVARPAKGPSRKTRLASANHDREAVLLAWAKYETDVALQIDFPAMTDVRKPETAALAKALRAAEIASRHAEESIDSLIRYEGSVLDLEGAFKAAETAAKLDQENPLTVDQKALAHTLLAMAVDPNGNLHERRQAHQRLLKLLDGVIVLAQPARLALEAATTRREIGQ